MCSRRCTVFGALCKGANNNTLWLQSSQYTGLYTVACLKLHKGAFQNKNPSFKMFILITSTCWTEHVLRWLSSFKMFGLTGKFNKLHWIPDYYTCAPGEGSREYIGITLIIYVRGGDSSVVRALDSWLKGHGFESLLERWENFLLQGRLSVLTLISVSVPPPCYHSST